MKAGYRHIDTAAGYGNEEFIGKAIRESGVPREEVFVTTKLWGKLHRDPKKALKESLDRLGLEYVDLFLMHWPVALNQGEGLIPLLPNGKRDIDVDWHFTKTWDLMQGLVGHGTKAIGVSNLSLKNLKELQASPSYKITPATNQIEAHPFLTQPKLLEYCKQNGIVVQAYSPLGSNDSPIMKDPVVLELAKELDISPATLLISWGLWRGTNVLSKSVTPARIAQNFQVADIDDASGEKLNDIVRKHGPRRLVNPPWDPVVVFNDDE